MDLKKIMVIDDDQNILHSIKQTLEDMDADYKVTCASSLFHILNPVY